MEHLGTDLVLVGSGSIRKKTFGPIVTLQDLMEIFPFNGRIYAAKLYGRDLKHAICYICRDEMLEGHTEFYQVSSNVRINYNFAQKKLLQFTVNGEDVEDDRLYTVALQAYHFNNISSCLDIPEEAVPGYDHPKCIATSDFDILL